MKNASTNVLSKSSQFSIRIALGPSLGQEIILTINRWLDTNGKEWTVSRLKSLRTAALQLRAGCPDLVRKIYQENSIAYFHGSLLPRGVYGKVFTLFLQAQKPSVLRRLEVVLRAYTSVYLSDLSEKQFLKAKKAITTPYQGSLASLVDARVKVRKGLVRILTGLHQEDRNRLFNRNLLPKIGKPSIDRLKMFTSTHKGDVKSQELGAIPYGKVCMSIATCPCWPRPFRDLYPLEVFDFVRSRVWSRGTDLDNCGHIGFIQEAGAKARVVAVPSALLQWGFEPLHRWLDRFLQSIPTSAVHDQNNGAFFIERHMKRDETLFCFDLSSATDRFPRSVQTWTLRLLGLESYAQSLTEVCSETFKVSTSSHEEQWEYKCGQPMGLYASFPLFSLTHLALVEGICDELGKPASNDHYQLVGDDVVIADREVAERYRQTLVSLGVEISESKTVQSAMVAEFAGFVGFRTNKSVALFRPYKHRDCKNVHNPIGLIHALGSALRRTGNEYWASKVKLFQKSRAWRNPDLSPLIPLSNGAEGVNPSAIDTTRLENLLAMACAMTGSTGNSWTGEEYDLFDLGRLASILLDKQDRGPEGSVRAPMDLLATPVEDPGLTKASVETAIKRDPLMSESTLEMLSRPVRQEVEPSPQSSSKIVVAASALEALDLMNQDHSLQVVKPDGTPWQHG